MANLTNHPLNNNALLYAVCEPFGDTRSGGILEGNGPTKCTLTLALVHIILANTFTAVFRTVLEPFGQVSYIAEMLGGVAIGPSFLSHNENFKERFFGPERGNLMLNSFERLALVFVFFLLHMYVDLSLIKRPGKLALAIGFATFLFPMLLSIPVSLFLRSYVQSEDLKQTLPFIGFVVTTSQFRQIVILLEDLKLLSSELGRTATISALISWGLNFVLVLVVFLPQSYGNPTVKHGVLFTHLSHFTLIMVIVFVFRPVMLWMMRRTPERRSLKESYICIIMAMVLACSFFGESTGQSFVYGPIMLGVATPNNPPMGSSLLQRLGTFVWAVFMPSCAIKVGKLVDIFHIGLENFLVVNLVIITATLGKILGAVLPSLYFNMPKRDAFSLGLILSSRGLFDILYVYRVEESKVISKESFGTIVVATLIHSLIIAPIFRAIYDTSRRYMAYNRRTIQHTKPQAELRMVLCIHDLDNVPSMLNVLEVLNPTRENPFHMYVLNLEELFGSLMPLFISHKYHGAPYSKPTRASGIVKHFNQYEQRSQKSVTVECFTSVAPYSTMHDDICSLANDKNTALVIFPFENLDGSYMRSVNKRVLENAPCSVATFFGRGILTEPRFLNADFVISVCVIFIGGSDDREALALGLRMVESPLIRLTVVRFIEANPIAGDEVSMIRNRIQDEDSLNNFKRITYKQRQMEHVAYKEEKIYQVSDTAKVLQSMENEFDLMVVGRRHDDTTPMLVGLSEWTEMEELGVIGDVILAWDAGRTSLLVVQQQALVIHEMLDKPKQH